MIATHGQKENDKCKKRRNHHHRRTKMFQHLVNEHFDVRCHFFLSRSVDVANRCFPSNYTLSNLNLNACRLNGKSVASYFDKYRSNIEMKPISLGIMQIIYSRAMRWIVVARQSAFDEAMLWK